MSSNGTRYGDYLQLDKLLDAQTMLSESKKESASHDEMLFIITHQAYELWFKQILFELDSILEIISPEIVDERDLGTVVARLDRIQSIQHLLVRQIDVIETMTPLDFLEFRDLLVPASGFESMQFKEIEIRIGLRLAMRTKAEQAFFRTRLSPDQQKLLLNMEQKPSLLRSVEAWLMRMPFLSHGDFDFWIEFRKAVGVMLEADREIVRNNPAISEKEKTAQLFRIDGTESKFDELVSTSSDDDVGLPETQNDPGSFRIHKKARLAALFIHLYRDEPILHVPFLLLNGLVEIDELFTVWRSRHALMAQRMLGTKIGTGGSSGGEYLEQNARQNRIFIDFFELPTFLIPRSARPDLPQELKDSLGFNFLNQAQPPQQ